MVESWFSHSLNHPYVPENVLNSSLERNLKIEFLGLQIPKLGQEEPTPGYLVPRPEWSSS